MHKARSSTVLKKPQTTDSVVPRLREGTSRKVERRFPGREDVFVPQVCFLTGEGCF